MRVKALQPMYYSRQMHAAGDEYDMDPREEAEAKVLALLGKIELLSFAKNESKNITENITPPLTYSVAAEEPEPDNEEEPRKRGYYRRRDMRAER
jgi:hypothetical protein